MPRVDGRWSLWSYRYIESILAGCLPVLFDRSEQLLPYNKYIDYRSSPTASILLFTAALHCAIIAPWTLAGYRGLWLATMLIGAWGTTSPGYF